MEGFINILEACRYTEVKTLIYASSSSVYGNNQNFPFTENDSIKFPTSIYGVSKRSNELMAYSYFHLYGLKSVGFRYFSAYGPWGGLIWQCIFLQKIF